jgi:CubicO group peptidase (beta-lactamase class C family)
MKSIITSLAISVVFVMICPNMSRAIPSLPLDTRDSIVSVLEKHSVPGAAIALVSADSIYDLFCTGYSDLETNTLVSESTLFCVGSCTKSFLGIGFLMLLQDGMIDLQMPVKEIIPEIRIDNPWQNAFPVRVVHLLEHTSGFDDIHANALYNEIDMEMPLKQALDLRPNSRRVRWKPGTRYSYSSPGYTTAGYILEKITGEQYEDYLEHNLLDSIGMSASTFRVTDGAARLLATGYDQDSSPLPYVQGFDRPASSLNSSVREMARFVRFLINKGKVGGRQMIGDTLMTCLGKPTTTVAAQAGLEHGYSFGVGHRFREGLAWLGHSGGGPGFTARYSVVVDNNLGYVVLINKFAPEAVDDICRIIEQLVAKQCETVEALRVEVPREILESYCGYYALRSSRIELTRCIDILFGGTTISIHDDILYQQDFLGDLDELLPVSDSMYRKENEPFASRTFTIVNGNTVYATRSSFYERSSHIAALLLRWLFVGALVAMLSSLIYALFWIPRWVYRVFRGRHKRDDAIIARAFSLAAVSSLVLGILCLLSQPLLDMGRMSSGNVVFFLGTLLFAIFSVCSLVLFVITYGTNRSLMGRLYDLLVSLACIGMTAYLAYWDIIGLRMWAY